MTETVEEYEEYEEYEEEFVEEMSTTTVTEQKTQYFQSGLPTRKVRKRAKVDTSKFMTPYLAHSQKMLEQFSHNKYRQAYDLSRGTPPAIVTDTPEMIRIRKAQEQLSEVKYRMEGNKARTTSLYDGEAKEVTHVKRVSELISKVLYRQKWDETKDRYLLPPDAPELVLAVKNAANYSKKLYTESWDEEKTMFYPYSDSPELRRVAKAQEVLSDLKYKEDYNKNVKGQWCETPYFDVAVARVAMENLSNRKYTQEFENIKDQIYFMQTETPVYDTNKRARIAASEVQYKKEYEKNKAQSDYNTLPATENPLLRQLRYAGTILSDKVYKSNYEKSRGFSINYCDTPKFQMDSVLKQFTDARYKNKYDNEVKGHYIGSYEDVYMLHCQKVEEMKNEQLYKAEYEDIKTRCFFPQTITPQYEATKKLQECSDKTYRKHPDRVKFTQVVDSPVLVQAAINAKQLSDLNYKAEYEKIKMKSSLPPDYPFFIQSRVNAFNLSDNCYKYDWEKSKAKKFEVKGDAISILAARAHTNIASDVKYKKEYEKNKGHMVGALSINDDPKILHSVHVAKIQSDREYKKDYEKVKTKYHTPLDMISVTLAKKSQGIASMAGYRSISTNFFYPPDAVLLDLAKKANVIQSDNEYKADYNAYTKGTPWIPFGSIDVEKNKKAGEILSEKKYRQHPDTIRFTSIDDHPVMMQAKVNQLQRSDLFYKRGLEEVHQKYSLPPDVPEFLQARCNAYNISNKYYKLAWQEHIAKGYDLKPNAISVVAAKAARHAASDVQYKKAYEKDRGHHVGFRSLQDDPLLVHYMQVAKIQSDKNYKKDYHKSKLKYHTPVDMMSMAHAKHASKVQTYAGYKQHHHNYCLLPGSMSLDLARNMSFNASDVNYKMDYENYVKGTGWVPIGSLEVQKAKAAAAALDEKKYRQHPDTIKFTSVSDSMNMELAKANAKILDAKAYKASGEKFMHTYHLPPDVPELMQARYNAVNISQNYYTYQHRKDLLKGHHVKEDAIPIVAAKSGRDIASNTAYKASGEKFMHTYHLPADSPEFLQAKFNAQTMSESHYKHKWLEDIAKGYDMKPDAISVLHAKHGRHIASNVQYKKEYEKDRGHHVGFRSLQDDPLLVHYMEVAKLQSDKNYKKDYHQAKLKYHTPVDMLSVVHAKQASAAQTMAGYKQIPHNYFLLPDNLHLQRCRNMNIQSSDSDYKSEWNNYIRGIGWVPIGSIAVETAKVGGQIQSDNKYRTHPSNFKFSKLMDSMDLTLATANNQIMNKQAYTAAWNKDKLTVHVMPDSPEIVLAKANALNMSNKLYKAGVVEMAKKGHNLKADAIPIKAAKSGTTIASNSDYKSEWNNYIRGIGWVPIGSIAVETAKVGGQIQSDNKYRTHPSNFKFSKLMDSMDLTLATANNQIMNKQAYTAAWNKDKLTVHVMPDSPEIVLAKANALNMSNKLYKAGVVEMAKKGYNLKADAIPIKAAKSGTTIASNQSYNKAWEKDKTSIHIMPDAMDIVLARGNRKNFSEKLYKLDNELSKKKGHNLRADAIAVKAAKASTAIASDKAYTEAWDKDKTSVHVMPDAMDVLLAKANNVNYSVKKYKQANEDAKKKGYDLRGDAVSILAARASRDIASDKAYSEAWDIAKRTIHIMPDAMDVLLAKANNVNYSLKKYKQANEDAKKKGYDLRGDAVSILAARASRDIASDKAYSEAWDIAKRTIHIMPDAMDVLLAKANNVNYSLRLYTEAWEKDKVNLHIQPDTPEIILSQQNAINMSKKLYKQGFEADIRKGYFLPPDSVSVKAAKASRDIVSDKNYIAAWEADKIKTHVTPDLPEILLSKVNAYNISRKNYREDVEALFRKGYDLKPDAVAVVAAKRGREIISDKAYLAAWENDKTNLHIMPDTPEIILAKQNKLNTSLKYYREGFVNTINKGYFLPKDAVSVLAAKASRDIVSDRKYKEVWEKDKLSFHLPPATPTFELSKANSINISNKLYTKEWDSQKAKGYHIKEDAISVLKAKASRDIISDAVYKADMEWLRGCGWVPHECVDVMKVKHAQKILADRGYRVKLDEQKYTVPFDRVDMVRAKNAADVLNEAKYREAWHEEKTKYSLVDTPILATAREVAKNIHPKLYTKAWDNVKATGYFMPGDAVPIKQCINTTKVQSKNVYRADLEWIRGCGWVAADSVDHVKVRKAQEILNERLYKKNAKECFGKFTLVVDRPEIVLAKVNAANLSDLKYKETFNAEKGHYIGSEDTPQLAHSREVSKNISEKLYKSNWDATKATSYQLNHEYIPLLSGKKGREIASDVKYKDSHEKAKGHYMAGTLVDFPEVVRCGDQEKKKGLRLYQKDYHQSKTKIHLPPDIIANKVAKNCQDMLSDVLYRTYLHQWTCHPEQEDAIRARKTNEILSDLKYRDEAKKEFNNYSIVTDTPVYVTAVLGHTWASDLNYKEAYHKEKHMYTTVLDTYDYARCHNFKEFFSNKNYTGAWDKIKAKSYQIPHDSHALQHAKNQKVILSNVKYKEDYEKFKSLYSLPKSLEDDPATARCVKAGKLVLDRLYHENYEKTKAKNHIPADMLEILSARNTQATVSGIHYRKYLHQWICLPDMQVYTQARKVNEQLSDIFYKDDLNWLKGIGCYAWDTPEILRVKHAGNLQSEAKYRAKGIEAFKDYSVVTDTPVYVTAIQNSQNLSDLHYRYDYNANIKGTNTAPAVTIETERARLANYIQSDNWYKEANKNLMPTGYSLPHDTPLIKQAKMNSIITSSVKYKEAYEMTKAKAYSLHPEGVNFVNLRNSNKIINDRLYRQDYHKQKDKIHTTYDTPDIKQVKMNQKHLSDLCYKEKYYNNRGQLISMPITPELMHCRHVNEITSELKYKEDLVWLRGLGCFLYDTPEMVTIRNITKQRVTYPREAKKNLANFSVVLDTPEYKRVTELKTHMSNLIYKAQSKQEMSKVSTTVDAVDIQRAKWAQQLTNKYKYIDLAAKERPHYTPESQTPDLTHAKKMKVVYSDNKYKEQYEKMKHRYTAIGDTPLLIRAKKSYIQSSDLRYKETFELAKGHYRTVKDALDITYHRRVTDDVSEVKYREKYINSLGTWKSIPDRPEFFFSKIVNDNVSSVKYKEDLDWLKGIGCYVWDTPELVLAENNKALYSERLYKASSEKNRGNFKYTSDTPFFETVKNASILINDARYKSKAKDLLKSGCNELHRPDILTALYQSVLGSKWRYRQQYERAKDKFTSILDTPEYETHKRKKKISDIIYKMEYNKTKAKAYTLPYDTPHQQHMKKVKEITSNLKYREVYEKSKAQINMDPEAHEIRAAKEAYRNITNLDYKKKYEATKAKWIWTSDRPDFLNAAKNSMQQSDVEYKYDKESMKGCVIPVVDDKLTLLAMKNNEMASIVKYKEKYEKEKGHYMPVQDTPQILHAKAVRTLASETRYKEASKKDMQSGSFTTLPQTRDTAHSKEVNKLVSRNVYKEKFEKEKGKSVYNHMMVPPDVQHAMAVAKSQSSISYKKDAKANLHYTSVADRPDIKKATQAAKLISGIGYRDKAREEASRGGSLVNRPDITLATEVSKLTSELKYKEKFDKEVKGKRPQYDLKESKIYKTLKDASALASEVKYKGDLKKIHKPVTDMAESLSMQHSLSTSRLSSQVKYKEKYEKEKGKAMLDFETPTYVTAKEAQHMQSQKDYKKDYEDNMRGKNLSGLEVTPAMLHVRHATKIASEKEYRKDLEEGVKGKGLTALEETPELLRARNATQILCEREYKKALEHEIKGKGMLALATDTPDFMRARNATDILSQTKYKQTAEMDRASYTTVIDTPDIIHAQQMRNIVSQKKYKEEAEKTMSHYVPVLDTPEMQRVRENQKNFSTVLYKDSSAKGTPVVYTPEMERVKRNQENISSVLYSDSFRKQVQGKAAFVLDTPEMRRVRETQRIISGVRYHEDFEKSKGSFTPTTSDLVTERVKRNTQDFSDISYRGIQRRVVEMERRRAIEHDQETTTDLRVWRTNPGSVFDYDPAEDNIQSRSLHMMSVQAQRRSKEHSRSTSALSGMADEKSEVSQDTYHHIALNGSNFGYQHAKTVELQQRSSSVATQQTTVSSIPSHPSTTGKTVRAMYDYTAADNDEVSFKDGDVIVNVQAIDEGWMYGTVQRTGKTGMLPANYVEAV
ncbi:Nebulin [Larimichthys crocea]|uniref:Uncharacterized protein n=1 Tax=Larimichthys crocea TaxID=215358 RepID=A0ACD3QI76_LARCR|nr:Nebulin [Larimichthys crocea]